VVEAHRVDDLRFVGKITLDGIVLSIVSIAHDKADTKLPLVY
jgi:hypothetical protein